MIQTVHTGQKEEEASMAGRLAMIEGQIRPNRVSDERLIDALSAVPRERFVPKGLRGVAYVDEDLEVAPGRYLMEPMVFARLLSEADIKPSDAVLDIGGATGYSAAVISHLAEAVVAVEEDEELAEKASARLAELGRDNVAVMEAPLTGGAPGQGVFDVIFLNGTVDYVPEGILDQLGDGGRLICVRRQSGHNRACLMIKNNGVVGARDLFDAFTPMLPGFEKKETFRF